MGTWAIKTVWGEYIVEVSNWTNFMGGSFHGYYTMNDGSHKSNFSGCFPLSHIRKMEKIA